MSMMGLVMSRGLPFRASNPTKSMEDYGFGWVGCKTVWVWLDFIKKV